MSKAKILKTILNVETPEKVVDATFKFMKIIEIDGLYKYENMWFDSEGNQIQMTYFFNNMERIRTENFNDRIDAVIETGKYKGKSIKALIPEKFNFLLWLALNPYLKHRKNEQKAARYWVVRILGEQSLSLLEWNYKLNRCNKIFLKSEIKSIIQNKKIKLY